MLFRRHRNEVKRTPAPQAECQAAPSAESQGTAPALSDTAPVCKSFRKRIKRHLKKHFTSSCDQDSPVDDDSTLNERYHHFRFWKNKRNNDDDWETLPENENEESKKTLTELYLGTHNNDRLFAAMEKMGDWENEPIPVTPTNVYSKLHDKIDGFLLRTGLKSPAESDSSPYDQEAPLAPVDDFFVMRWTNPETAEVFDVDLRTLEVTPVTSEASLSIKSKSALARPFTKLSQRLCTMFGPPSAQPEDGQVGPEPWALSSSEVTCCDDDEFVDPPLQYVEPVKRAPKPVLNPYFTDCNGDLTGEPKYCDWESVTPIEFPECEVSNPHITKTGVVTSYEYYNMELQ